ncbi:MAG: hypothetical protein JWN86_412 [Planctomycetota bacterium]|nr:hypothetical protein [Planctomycetota bacterium]
MRKPNWALVLMLALAAMGCQAVRIEKEDSRGHKTAKVAGRAVQGVATGWLSEAYYAGQRARE